MRHLRDLVLVFCLIAIPAGFVLAGEGPPPPPGGDAPKEEPKEEPKEAPAPPAEEPKEEPPPAKKKVAVPDLSNQPLLVAKINLKKLGLLLGNSESVEGKGKPGLVFEQSPAAGTEVEEGTAVDVKVGAKPKIVMVPVPDLKGQKETAARAKLIASKLKAGTVTRKVMAGKGGEVLSQSPAAGTQVKEGSTVTLTVGKEPARKALPKLVGLSLQDAGRKLIAAGFQFDIEYKPSPGKAPGTVVSSDPAGGAMAVEGATIRLVVAAATAPVYKVPDVRGKSKAEAEKTVVAAKLTVGEISHKLVDPDKPEGIVLDQDPKPGQELKRPAPVDLVLSRKRPENPVVPDLAGKSKDASELVLREAGLQLGKVIRRPSKDKPAGSILEQQPPAGAKVAPGTPVSIVIATDGSSEVKVPVVLRMSLDEARKTLEKAGLQLGEVEDGPSYMKEFVVRQRPFPNATVSKGTAVKVTITRRP